MKVTISENMKKILNDAQASKELASLVDKLAHLPPGAEGEIKVGLETFKISVGGATNFILNKN